MLETKQCLARHTEVSHCLSMANLFLITQYWVTDQKDYATPMDVKIILSNHLNPILASTGTYFPEESQ